MIGAWDQASPLTAPWRSSVYSADQVRPESPSSKAPDIVLQPPSAPESEEEDNNCETVGTVETELEREEAVLKQDEMFKDDEEEDEEKLNYEADFGLKKSKIDKGNVLISVGDDINLPPQPEIPAVFDNGDDDNDDELPAPPPCGADLITFSESEDQRDRSDLENEFFKIQSASPAAQGEKQTNILPGIKCTCENLQLLQTIKPVQELKTSNNSLFFDTREDGADVDRPAPIVLTRNRNGPIKAAVAVRRSNSASVSRSSSRSSGSSRSPLPQSVSVDLSRERSTRSLPIRQQSLPEPRNMERPYSSSDVVTIRNAQKIVKKPEERPQVDMDSEPEPFAQASDLLIPETSKEEKDLNRYSCDSNDFPPPPPSIEDTSTTDQGDSPWVPLMSRFQIEDGTLFISESEEPLLPQRRPKPKTSTGVNDQKVPKFRSYTPKAKPTYVEVKDGEDQNQQSETCV